MLLSTPMERLIYFSLLFWLNYLVLLADGVLSARPTVCFYLFLALIAYPIGNVLFALLNGERADLAPYFSDIVKILLSLMPICLIGIFFGIGAKGVLAIAIPSLLFVLFQNFRREDVDAHSESLFSRLNPFKERMGKVRLAFLLLTVLTTTAVLSMFQITEHKDGYVIFNPEVGDTSTYWSYINSLVRHKGNLLGGFYVSNLSGMNIRDLFPDVGFFYYLTLILEICEAEVAGIFQIDAITLHSVLWGEFGLLLLTGACWLPATKRDAAKGPWLTAASGMTAFLFFSTPILIGWGGISYLVAFIFRSDHMTYSCIALILALKLFLSFNEGFRSRDELPKIIVTSTLFFLSVWFHVITGILFFASWIVFLILHEFRRGLKNEIKPRIALLIIAMFSITSLFVIPRIGAGLKISTFEAASNFAMMRINLSFGSNAWLLPFSAFFLGWGVWHFYGQNLLLKLSNFKRSRGALPILMALGLTVAVCILLVPQLWVGGMMRIAELTKMTVHSAQPGSAIWYIAFLIQELTNLSKALAIMAAFSGIWIPLAFIFFKTGNSMHRTYSAILFVSIFLVIWVAPSPAHLANTGKLGGGYMALNIFLGAFFMAMATLPTLSQLPRTGLPAKTAALILASACAVWFNHFSSFLGKENLRVPEKLYSALEYIKFNTDANAIVLMNTKYQDYYALVAGFAGRGAVAERSVYLDIYQERSKDIAYFYGNRGFDPLKAFILRKYAITHVLVPAGYPLDMPEEHFESVFSNHDYILYRYKPALTGLKFRKDAFLLEIRPAKRI